MPASPGGDERVPDPPHRSLESPMPASPALYMPALGDLLKRGQLLGLRKSSTSAR